MEFNICPGGSLVQLQKVISGMHAKNIIHKNYIMIENTALIWILLYTPGKMPIPSYNPNLPLTSHRRTIQLEVSRLKSLEDLTGIILLRNTLKTSLISITISSNGILEHASIIHINILIEQTKRLGLLRNPVHKLVDKRIDSLVVRSIIPPARDLQNMHGHRITLKSERITTKVLHILQHRLGNSLENENRLGTGNTRHLGEHRHERLDSPEGEVLVQRCANRPVYLAQTGGILGLKVFDVLDEGLRAGGVGDSGDAAVLVKDFRVGDILRVC
jgi:hypothetical protein